DGGFAAGDLALAAGFDYRPAPGHVRRSLGPRHAVQDLARVVVWPGRGVSVRPHFSVADECPIALERPFDGRHLHQLSNAPVVVYLPVRISDASPPAARTTAVEALSAAAPALLFLGALGRSHCLRHSALRAVPARLVCSAAPEAQSCGPG